MGAGLIRWVACHSRVSGDRRPPGIQWFVDLPSGRYVSSSERACIVFAKRPVSPSHRVSPITIELHIAVCAIAVTPLPSLISVVGLAHVDTSLLLPWTSACCSSTRNMRYPWASCSSARSSFSPLASRRPSNHLLHSSRRAPTWTGNLPARNVARSKKRLARCTTTERFEQ